MAVSGPKVGAARLRASGRAGRRAALAVAACSTLGVGLITPRLASAASTWTGGGGNVSWSTAANWTGGTPTSSQTTDVIFDGTTNTGTSGTPLNQNISAEFEIRSITFASGAGSFFIGGSSFQVDTAVSIVQDSANAQSISNVFTKNNASNDTETLTLAGDGSGVVTLSGNIVDGATSRFISLIKDGTSTFVLSGAANTYAGNTTINAGTIRATDTTSLGSTTSALDLTMNGGVLDLAINTSIDGYDTVISGDATITSNRSTAGAGVTHTLGTLGIGAFTLNITAGSSVTSGTAGVAFAATTLSATGATLDVGTGAQLTLGALTDGGAKTFTKSGPGTLTLGTNTTNLTVGTKLNIAAGTVVLANSTPLDTVTDVTLSTGGTLSLTSGATVAALNSAASNTGSVTLSTATLTVGSGNNLSSSFSGVISGSGGLIKAGTGVFSLSAPSTYTGTTVVTAGTLQIADPAALGTSALRPNGGNLDLAIDSSVNPYNTTMAASSTITSNRATAGAGITHTLGTLSIGNFTLNIAAGANVTSGTAGVTFGATSISVSGANFAPAASTELTLGALSGNNTFTKSGAGQLTLNTASLRSSGAVTLSGGTMRLGSTSALGTTAVTLAASGSSTLDLATDTSVNAYPYTVSGTTTVASNRATAGAGITHTLGTLAIGAFTLNITPGGNVTSGTAGVTFGATTLSASTAVLDVAANAHLTLGALSGNFTLTKQGAGTLTLGSASTRSAAGNINNGVLRLTNATGLGTGGIVTVGGATLEIGNFAVTGPDLTLNNGANLIASGGTSSSYDDTGDVYPSIGTAANVMVATRSSGEVFTFNSAFRGGNSASVVTVDGPGTVVLTQGATNASAFAGSWVLDGASTTVFRLDAATALGNPNGGSNHRPIALRGGTFQLRLDAGSTFSQATTLAGDAGITPERATSGAANTHTLGTLTVDDGLPAVNTLTLTVNHGTNYSANNSGNLTFTATTLTDNVTFALNNVNGTGVGVVTLGALGDGGVAKTIIKGGNGALTLGANATSLVDGTALNITAGSVNSNSASALGTLANVTLSTGATLNLGAAQTLGALNSAASNTGAVTLGANALTIGSTNNLPGSFAGVISGTGSLTKAGNGTQRLTGTNTYSGTTTVTAGKLLVNGGLASPGGAVSVTGGELGGTGSVSRSVTIDNGGSVAPGDGDFSIANFNINQTATTTTFAGGGTYVWELNSVPGSGTAGTNWDTVTLNSLSVTATSGSKFTIRIVSLNAAGNAAGSLSGVSPVPGTQYTWTIAQNGALAGFDAAAFQFDTTAFSANAGGDWSISSSGNNVEVTLTVVPEPGSAVSALAALAAGALTQRRRPARCHRTRPQPCVSERERLP